MMTDKINNAIRILQIAAKEAGMYNEPVEIAYSGGKDSDCLLQLAREAGIPYRAIYKNTTIDPPGTIQHCRANGVEIMHPKQSFFEMIKKHGFPSFRFRFCCAYLKEYKILNVAAWGVRADESNARAKRYTTESFCRTYKKGEKVSVYTPLYNWTLEDVVSYIESRNLKLAPHYYDADGNPDYNRRLGCIGCPMAYNKAREFLTNKNFLRAYLHAGQKWCDTHPHALFADVYELFVYRVFYRKTINYKMDYSNNTLFGKPNAKNLIENYFDIKL